MDGISVDSAAVLDEAELAPIDPGADQEVEVVGDVSEEPVVDADPLPPVGVVPPEVWDSRSTTVVWTVGQSADPGTIGLHSGAVGTAKRRSRGSSCLRRVATAIRRRSCHLLQHQSQQHGP